MGLHGLIRPLLPALLSLLTMSARASAADQAHLLPIGPTFDVGPPIGRSYSRACERMVFGKSNWILRYFRASESITTGLSIVSDARGRYSVSVKQARPELYSVVANAFYRKLDLQSALESVKVNEATAEIPESVAKAVHRQWVALLSNVRSNEKLPDPYILSAGVILYAKTADGNILEGKMPPGGFRYKNLASVEDVVDDLLKVCAEPERRRKNLFGSIEERAAAFSGEEK